MAGRGISFWMCAVGRIRLCHIPGAVNIPNETIGDRRRRSGDLTL
jgi:hypothetical protein